MRAVGRWRRQPVATALAAGAVLFGAAGTAVGLVRGLVVYAPTAWAAALEVGVPAAFLGATLGLLAGVLVLAGRRMRRSAAQLSASDIGP